MNNNFREGLKVLKEISDPEKAKLILEKITGKKLADYEGIDALVGALMGYYNEENKKKLNKGNLPTQIGDAKGIYDLLENNSGLNFDLELVFLNNVGIKIKGKIYFDKNKKGMFKCIKETTSTVNSTEFFVDISNNANSDKLENLGRKALNLDTDIGISSTGWYKIEFEYKYRLSSKIIISGLGGTTAPGYQEILISSGWITTDLSANSMTVGKKIIDKIAKFSTGSGDELCLFIHFNCDMSKQGILGSINITEPLDKTRHNTNFKIFGINDDITKHISSPIIEL